MEKKRIQLSNQILELNVSFTVEWCCNNTQTRARERESGTKME